MCGICGVVQLDRSGGEFSHETLVAMTDAMTHRGPDEQGFYERPGVALGVRRLSIVDVRDGHQPVSDEQGHIWAIQNGELYNHLELRSRLDREGHTFRSRCDTEILPHLYERYGADFPAQLRGMFGIAVWDETRRRLVLVRDRLGIKPLYYARAGGAVVFASELKSLLTSGLVAHDLDREAVAAYLTLGFVPGPRTLLAGVSKLMPGEELIAEGSEIVLRRYWRYPTPTGNGQKGGRPPGEYAEELLSALDESVLLRLMSDVPLGAMLSGGLDSSLIVALMSRHMSEPVKTFSVGFSGLSSGNELADARLVAKTFGTDHHELELPIGAEVDLEDIVWSMDEPVADLSTIGFSALCRLAADHVTVALAGQGADELLGGYSRHRVAALIGWNDRLPTPVQNLFALGTHLHPRLRRLRQLADLDPVSRFVAMKNHLPQMVTTDRSAANSAVRSRLPVAIEDPLASTLYLDAQLGLVDDMLHYFDRMSMAHSLEVRVPFLDHKVVEFCATIPSSYKVRHLTTKYVLKLAARGIVPDRIIDKPKIGFFNNAVSDWTRHAIRGVARDYLLSPSARYTEFVDRTEIEKLLAGAESGNGKLAHSEFLLALLMLEVWLSSYLPRTRQQPVLGSAAEMAVS